jgi:hypothetical protein
VDIEDSIIAVAESIGPDYTDLAPEGEAHFDPVTVATFLACHILYAVGAGITEGITEAAKDGTVAVLNASARHIKDRLVPQSLRRFFTGKPDSADAGTDLAEAQRKAGDSLTAAAAEAGQLDPAAVAQIAAATAVAVKEALRNAGLKDTATIRVKQAIETQVEITLSPAAT